MDIKVKKSKDNKWGFVESYKKWCYLNPVGYVEVVTGIAGTEGSFTKPYVFRGEEFVPLNIIAETVGVDRYLKAKKPFYSLLTDGLVAKIRIYVNFETGEYVEEKSTYDIYSVIGISDDETVVFTNRLREVPESLRIMVKNLMSEASKIIVEKEKFLTARM